MSQCLYYGVDLWSHPWPRPRIFKAKFWKSRVSGKGGPDCFGTKTWWRHQMETFSALLAICAGEFTGLRWIPRSKASDAGLWSFLSSTWINGWVNNGEAGDLRRHRAHYNVTVMRIQITKMVLTSIFDVTHDIDIDDWHWMRGIWFDRILDLHPLPYLWPWP